MSTTEVHSGKLKKIELGEKSLEDFSKEVCESKGIMQIPAYNSNWLSTMIDSIEGKYFCHNGTLYEFVDHVESDDEEYFMKLNKNPDGTIGFFGQFYNGGTCLEEMLEEAFDEFMDESDDEN